MGGNKSSNKNTNDSANDSANEYEDGQPAKKKQKATSNDVDQAAEQYMDTLIGFFKDYSISDLLTLSEMEKIRESSKRLQVLVSDIQYCRSATMDGILCATAKNADMIPITCNTICKENYTLRQSIEPFILCLQKILKKFDAKDLVLKHFKTSDGLLKKRGRIEQVDIRHFKKTNETVVCSRTDTYTTRQDFIYKAPMAIVPEMAEDYQWVRIDVHLVHEFDNRTFKVNPVQIANEFLYKTDGNRRENVIPFTLSVKSINRRGQKVKATFLFYDQSIPMNDRNSDIFDKCES